MYRFIYNKVMEDKSKEYTVKVDKDGTKRWYYNGKLHRTDGPAVETLNGTKEWWLNDKLHREDGPAVEYDNGDNFQYYKGYLHREDGPACEYEDGVAWYLRGVKLTEESFKSCAKSLDGKEIEIDGIKYRLNKV